MTHLIPVSSPIFRLGRKPLSFLFECIHGLARASVRYGSLCAVAAIAAVPVCLAAPVVVPPYAFSGFASTGYISVFPTNVISNVNLNGQPLPSGTLGGAGDTSATLTYGSVLTPQLSASATVISNNPLEAASANLLMELDYFLIATGPGPVATVHVTGFGKGTNGAGSFLGVSAPSGFAPINVHSPFTPNWILDTTFVATTGIAYTVRLQIQISLTSVGDGMLTQNELVDPIFTIDPSTPNADQYRIDLSPGIGNGASAVPEPANLGAVAVALCVFTTARQWLRRKPLRRRERFAARLPVIRMRDLG